MTLDQLRTLCDAVPPGPWSLTKGQVLNIRDAAARTALPLLLAVAEAAKLQRDYGEPHSAHAEIAAALAALEAAP